MIDICLFSGKDEWDAYVSQNHQSSFSHLYGWGEALTSVYDLKIFRLAARDRNKQGENHYWRARTFISILCCFF